MNAVVFVCSYNDDVYHVQLISMQLSRSYSDTMHPNVTHPTPTLTKNYSLKPNNVYHFVLVIARFCLCADCAYCDEVALLWA